MIDFIFFILIFLLGYVAGYLNGKAQDAVETIIDGTGKTITIMRKKIKEVTTPAIKTGIIKPPTAKDLADRKLPQKVKEGRAAMKETLDNIPELVEHKKKLEEFNRTNRGIYDK